MKKRYLLILAAVLALALAAAAAVRSSSENGPPMEEGDVRVYCDAGGALSLAWPETEGAEYRLSVRPDGGSWSEEQALAEPFAALDGVGAPFQVRIQAVDRATGKGGPTRTIAIAAAELEAPVLTASLGKGYASLTWTDGKGSVYEVASPDSPEPLANLEEAALELRFGPEEAMDLPGYDQPLRVTVRAGVPGEHYIFYGPPSQALTIRREALLNDTLSLTCEETQPRIFTLEWMEGRGDHYEVQEWRGGDWTLLERVEPSASPRYETERLVSGSHHRLRVAAVDSAGSVLAAEETEFYASVDPLYATVWPILDLNFCKEPNGRTLKRISAGTALCVLEETDGWFQVRYGNDYGYVDSRYCMINLAEYLGDYCSYDITNSYASIFKVHNSPIAKVTRQVIPGFEYVRSADGFLVPYLYPSARKLLQAAKSALEDGYRLRIYEAFRPNQSTRYLYDTTSAQLNYAALTEQGGYCIDPQLNCRVDLATGLYTDPATGKQVPRSALAPPEPEPEPEPETPPAEEPPVPETPASPAEEAPPAVPESGGEPQEREEPPVSPAPEEAPAPEVPESPEAPVPEEGDAPPDAPVPEETGGFLEARLLLNAPAYDTYGRIMTDNGRFGLGSFLARSVSAHNRGIALDLTMETLEGGRTLTMQSAMHDLSWYSVVSRNNDNARLLEKYMTAAGMRGLSSEWWHFQDDKTRESIHLDTYLSKGVDASGWTRDDHGWRWRSAAGTVQRNTTITVDGVRWTLDSNGYVTE